MERAELERLDRETLIHRAEAAGVTRARILTRPELVDELLLRALPTGDPAAKKARGFFGRARDLLARVVERGLHLPDAAERIRKSFPPPPVRGPSSALPTVTLAEIYAAQGHKVRAVETLRRVLEAEPDHTAARALLAQLEDGSFPVPPPPLPPEPEEEQAAAPVPEAAKEPEAAVQPVAEPLGMLDDEPLPTKYDVDECVAIPVDPTTLFVYWEVRDLTLNHLRNTRSDGGLAVRLVIITPTWDGPRSSVWDQDVGAQLGDWFFRDLPAGCVVRAAIGWRVGDVFIPIAHSPALETPPGSPSPILADVLVRWTPHGAVPVTASDADAASIERALGIARRRYAEGEGPGGTRAPRPSLLGSSEVWGGGPEAPRPSGASERWIGARP